MAAAWGLANWSLLDAVGFGSSGKDPIYFSDLFPTLQLLFWVFLAWCGIYFSIEYRHQMAAREIDLAKARAFAADAQNRMLRYQLNPHFLFNTLNAISALVLEDKRDQAERVLLALSRFLRYSLEQDPSAKTTLRAELSAQEEYLAIEQIRFGDKFRYVTAVEPATLDLLVPCFILQPAVENAIKYAVAPSARTVTMEIAANLRGDKFVLAVRDDGSAEDPQQARGLGVGLENVKQRLDVLYGSRATMASRPREGGGFEFEVRLPVERA